MNLTNSSLQDKVVVVTGGVRDIGGAISLKLAALGAKLAINYHGSAELSVSLLKQIQSAGGEAIMLKGDMSKLADVEALAAACKNAYGETIDCLVNVAGGLVARKTVDEMDEDFFNQVIQLNLNSVFYTTKVMAPLMTNGGSIVNLASQAGRDGGGPGASAYACSKGAVMTFTRAMAKELGAKNIRVNSLCPGMISTTFHDTFTKDQVRTNVAAATPLKREGLPAEMASVVAFLASDESSFITGVNLDTNGGLLFS